MKKIRLLHILDKKKAKSVYKMHLQPLVRLESYDPKNQALLAKYKLDRCYNIIGLDNHDHKIDNLILQLQQDGLLDKEFANNQVDNPIEYQQPSNLYPSGTDLTHLQYLLGEPNEVHGEYIIGGLNINAAKEKYGDATDGRNVRVAILEATGCWYVGNEDDQALHEDLPLPDITLHSETPEMLSQAHSNQVAGIIYGKGNNGIGINGIAPKVSPISVLDNINHSADQLLFLAKFLKAGDVVSISTGFAKGPYENNELVSNVIAYLTESIGVIFVEAAGNYNDNIDNVLLTDSGAIIVGALDPRTNDRFISSNIDSASSYGNRVNLCAWGDAVPTTYNVHNEDPDLYSYTDSFNYTSCATPQVAGCVAIIQSVLIERGLKPLTSKEMRKLLYDTGTRNLAENTNTPIGRMPNVLLALDTILAKH